MAEIPRLDFEQRIGDTLAMTFQFRQDDGSLRNFTGSTAIFHAESGASTIHISSATPGSGIEIIDGTETAAGPGGTDCAILVKIPYGTTETWESGQTWFYEVKEWTGPERYALIDGVITATPGVVDGAD